MVILLTFALFFTVLSVVMFSMDIYALVLAVKEKRGYTKSAWTEVICLFLACLFWSLFLTL